MERIAVKDYQATDDDIMRARLKRSGVKEYRMVFENGKLPLLVISVISADDWFYQQIDLREQSGSCTLSIQHVRR